MYHRLKPAAADAHHVKMNESSIRTIVQKDKEICEAITAAMPTAAKALHFLQNIFLSHIKNAVFTGMKDCYKRGVPID